MMPAVPFFRLRVPLLMAVALSGVLGVTGCGGTTGRTDVPEPATAPPVAHAPAGTVVALPGDPEGLAVDARDGILAAGLRDPDGVALISTTTGREQKMIHLAGAPRHLALQGPAGPLLVPLEQTDQLVRLALPSGQIVTWTRLGRQPHDAAAAAAGTVFVGNEYSNTVSLVQDGRQVAQEPAPLQPGGVAADPNGSVVIVVGVRGRRLEEYTFSGRSLGSAPVGVGPTHIVAGGNDLFYAADTEGNAIDVFLAAAGPRQVATVPTRPGAPYGLALDRTRSVLYVTLTASNQLESFKIKGNTVVPARVWPTVRQPDSVAVDSATGRVFVASRTGGGLQLIDP
jgi:sugar lactone lactonase YvrE